MIYLLFFLPVYYLSLFLHEVGHAVFGRAGGYAVTSLGIGFGRPLFVRSWRGVRLYICRRGISNAATFVYAPQILPSRRQQAVMFAGGMFVNALLALIGLAAWRLLPWGEPFWLVLLTVNAFLLFCTVLPTTVRVGRYAFATDGAHLWNLLRRREEGADWPEFLRRFPPVREHLVAVGDTVNRAFLTLLAAQATSVFGDDDRAEFYVAEAKSLLRVGDASVQAYASWVAAAVACGRGDFAACRASLTDARCRFEALNVPVGLFLVEAIRADAQTREKDRDAALATLESLAADPLIAHHPSLKAYLLAAYVAVHSSRDEPEKVEAFRAEYEGVRRLCPSPLNDLQVFGALGGLYTGRGEWGRAADAFIRVVEAQHTLFAALPDNTLRTHFLDKYAALLGQAKDSLTRAGKPEEAENIDARFALPDETASAAEPAIPPEKLRRGRRCFLIGMSLMLVNLIALGVIVALLYGLHVAGDWSIALLLFVVAAAATLLVDLIVLAFVRSSAMAQAQVGILAVAVNAIPWVTFLLFLAAGMP